MLLLLGLHALNPSLAGALKFVLAVFQPCVFMTSKTRDSFREIVMIVPFDRLSNCHHHDQWELWLQVFLEQFNVSGGAVVFVNCMSDQMIGAMDHIHHGKQLKWNLTKHCNIDFGHLWMLLVREHETQTMTQNIYARMCEEKIHMCS